MEVKLASGRAREDLPGLFSPAPQSGGVTDRASPAELRADVSKTGRLINVGSGEAPFLEAR